MLTDQWQIQDVSIYTKKSTGIKKNSGMRPNLDPPILTYRSKENTRNSINQIIQQLNFSKMNSIESTESIELVAK